MSDSKVEAPLACRDDGVNEECTAPTEHDPQRNDSQQEISANSEEVSVVDTLISDLNKSHTQLQTQTRAGISSLKLLLDQKEADLLACYKTTFEYKLHLLNDYRQKLCGTSAGGKPTLPPLPGGSCCGFIPEMTNLVHSSASLVLEHRGEVEEGDQMKVSVIGSLSKEGRFWVRILPDDGGIQDVMLQNLSNTIGVELSMSSFNSLQSARVGDLCCALYSEDQRWYRGRVVELLVDRKATVYFLDYGNTETISFSNLSKLHPKFLVYPFQMIQCCFSTDTSLTYSREVKWKFTDITHGSHLTVKILQNLHDNVNGKLHLVQLTNRSGGQPFDVEKTILVMAGMEPTQPTSIKYRDIRYAHDPSSIQTTNAQAKAPSETTPIVTVTTTSGKAKDQEEAVASDGGQVPVVGSTDSVLPLLSSSAPMDNVSQSTSSTSSSITTSSSSHNSEAGHVTGVGLKEQSVKSASTDVDVIASAAQIKVVQSAEIAVDLGSHSPIPVSHSGSPSPVPVSGRVDSLISIPVSTNLTSKTSKSTPAPAPVPAPGAEQYPTLQQGDEVEVYAVTPLSSDGSFTVQLVSSEKAEFVGMVEQLQRHCQEEPPTPVFFSPGDICAAQFSEDSCWYRAQVEGVVREKFLVRYLDFGNSETLSSDYLMPLRSEFRRIPFQAFQCSIAYHDHTSFSEKEVKCFEKLTDTHKLTAKILGVKEQVYQVQLLLSLSNGPINLNDEVYTADVNIGQSMSFSLGSGSLDMSKEGVPPQHSWADFMDDIQSPQNDGIFTLPGQDSEGSRSHTPTPTPRRPSPSPQHHRSTPPPSSRSHNHTSLSHDVMQTRTSQQRSRSPNPTGGPRPQAGVSRSGSAPRIHTNALGIVRKSLLGPGNARERKERAKSDQPQGGWASNSSSSSSSTAPPPGLAQPKGIHSINQVSRNGTSFPPTGRRRKSPEPEATQVKLFVRYMPHNKTMADVYHLFGLYGHIHMLEYHTEHKDKLYLIMDREGGLRAIDGLNGSRLTGSPKPLAVQPYKVSSVLSPEQENFDSLSTSICTRLFVKNVPLNRSMEDLKGIFTQYGRVFGIVPIPSRKNVVYVYMDPDGAQLTIDKLHGKAVAKTSKPLVIEVSQTPSWKSRS